MRCTVAVLVGAFAIVAALSCEDAQVAEPCTNIPPGGCPLSRGLACEDPSCEAVYACRAGGTWEFDRMCPPRATLPPVDSGVVDALPTHDAALDAPPGANGGPGCGTLQGPDCSLGFALVCPPGAGCCDCEDLFVCANATWTLWGTCELDGGIRERR